MVLHVVEEVQDLVVVGPMAGLTREFVHVRGPAGGFDGGDGHWVDFTGGSTGWSCCCPGSGGRMHDVRFGKGADLGHDGFFLLEKHATGFEVADFGHHGALHDGAAFVVFDIAHPPRFVQRDVFGETLFFEVPDSVVIGICEKVLDWGSCFDVVF